MPGNELLTQLFFCPRSFAEVWDLDAAAETRAGVVSTAAAVLPCHASRASAKDVLFSLFVVFCALVIDCDKEKGMSDTLHDACARKVEGLFY